MGGLFKVLVLTALMLCSTLAQDYTSTGRCSVSSLKQQRYFLYELHFELTVRIVSIFFLCVHVCVGCVWGKGLCVYVRVYAYRFSTTYLLHAIGFHSMLL